MPSYLKDFVIQSIQEDPIKPSNEERKKLRPNREKKTPSYLKDFVM